MAEERRPRMDFRAEMAKVAPRLRRGGALYLWGTGAHLAEMRRAYYQCCGIRLEEYVDAFIDSDPQKQKGLCFGRPVLAPDAPDYGNAVVMVSTLRGATDIRNFLLEKGLNWNSDFFDRLVLTNLLKKQLYTELLQWKGRHAGQRCFIIGNGPSLRAEDLGRLQNDICFGVNKIYKIFEDTPWRPTYYMAEDRYALAKWRTIGETMDCPKFLHLEHALEYPDAQYENAFFFSSDMQALNRPYPYNKPEFSTQPDRLCWGSTIAYAALQMAAYMGFGEIYLLGVDMRYNVTRSPDGEVRMDPEQKPDHFSKDYNAGMPTSLHTMYSDIAQLAFERAREFAQENDFRIYNATRGGQLEVFERANFDVIV